MTRIAIIDANNSRVGFLDNSSDKALHFWNDEMHSYLEGNCATFEFESEGRHENAQLLKVGNRLSFTKDNIHYFFNIMNVQKDHDYVKVQAYSTMLELLNEMSVAFNGTSLTFVQYINLMGFEKQLKIGINEITNRKRTYKNENTDSTILKMLYTLANEFSCELEFKPVLNQDYTLNYYELNIYEKHSDKYQGVGSDRKDLKLIYGKNINSITKRQDITELYTVIRPTGKDGLTLASYPEQKLYDADGYLEYWKPANNPFIYAPQARNLFPATTQLNTSGDYILKIVSTDYSTQASLYGYALAELKKNCVPKTSYAVEGYFKDLNIGDTVTIQDQDFNPALYVKARVVEIKQSIEDLGSMSVVFDNFSEMASKVDNSLIDLQNLLKKPVYVGFIDTDNGIVFKNGIGSTTLTAKVRDGIEDVSSSLQFKWYKDGEILGVYPSITVSAKDVAEKAVYKFEAYNDNADVIAKYEVTVSNVDDGEKGDPGEMSPEQIEKLNQASEMAVEAKSTAETASETATTATTTANNALDIASSVNMHFWSDGDGIHITQTEKDEPIAGLNVLINTTGFKVRDGLSVTSEFGENTITLGANDENAVIQMCGNRGQISNGPYGMCLAGANQNEEGTVKAGPIYISPITSSDYGFGLVEDEEQEGEFKIYGVGSKIDLWSDKFKINGLPFFKYDNRSVGTITIGAGAVHSYVVKKNLFDPTGYTLVGAWMNNARANIFPTNVAPVSTGYSFSMKNYASSSFTGELFIRTLWINDYLLK